MSGSRSRGIVILGIFIVGIALALFIHDAEYIFTGKTVDLNEILASGEELPRDKFVTYTCRVPIGNYAETQEYISGIIPLPFKTQQYAMIGENGMIFSAAVGKEAKIEEMDNAIDAFYDDETVSVTLTGNLQINSSKMDTFLEEFVRYEIGSDLESSGLFLTSFVIDTTKTRLSQSMLYIFLFALGAFMTVVGIRTARRG